MSNKKPLIEWETEKGIELRKRKWKNWKNNECTERQFKNLLRKNYIIIKTEKGLNYYQEEVK